MAVFHMIRLLSFSLLFACIPALNGCSVVAAMIYFSRESAEREEAAREASEWRQGYRDEIVSGFRLDEPLPNQCPTASPQPWITREEAARLPLHKLRLYAEKGDAVAQTEAARKLYAALVEFDDSAYYSDKKRAPKSRFKEASDEDLKHMGSLGLHYARCAAQSYPQAYGLYGLYQWSIYGDGASGEDSIRKGCRAGSLEGMLFLRAKIAELPITSGRELAALGERLEMLPDEKFRDLPDTRLSYLVSRWRAGKPLPEPQPWSDFEDIVPPLAHMRNPARHAALFAEFEEMWLDLPACRRLPEVIYQDSVEYTGINIARIRRNKALADRGDTTMQHGIGATLDSYSRRFPRLAQRLDKAIRHYYGCVDWPITRMRLANYLERQGDCAAMDQILRTAVVEENLRRNGNDIRDDDLNQLFGNDNLNQLLRWHLHCQDIGNAAARPLIKQALAAHNLDELAAALPPLELCYDADQKLCLPKNRSASAITR